MLPKYHQKLGHEVSVIASLVSFDKNGKPCTLPKANTYFSTDGYKVIRLNYRRCWKKINSFIRRYENLSESLKTENPDILFIHDYSFADIIQVMRYAKRNNIQVFIDCHTDYINSAKSWISKHIFHHVVWRFIGRKILPYVSMFYGVTPLRCDFLRNAYKIPEAKVELLLMGVDDDLLQQKLNLGAGERLREKLCLSKEFVILTGGKIDMLKNIHLVLEAFRNIESFSKEVTLVVFGTIAPEAKEKINELLVHSKIKFVGWLSSDEILDYYIMSDLIVFPGTHSVLWEQAVGTGTPAIFKYWEGITHVDVGGNALFLKHDSVEEIESILTHVIDKEGVYEEMLKSAQQKGCTEFAYTNIAKKSLGCE
ncbi:glycosyltransferase family 4 protein [Sphingobacterium faecale]|uniref:Glycosyltransferase family 4 protein n=1 Tax=Sphingobacterium faecale TaxID=2803775 RepID=A0ABS1R762_9SPHI|nr:glycosyltransferase family 4 protein [Sphingobacterium faecale]MBL1410340.1 glycosyltransferase family 4 protein [Sphingobacterium faecale]